VLIRLGIIKKENSVTERKGKKNLYFIDDNFFNFFFIFAEPYRSDLEIGEIKNVENKFKRDFLSYVGKKFEKLIRNEILKKIDIIDIEKAGRCWGKIPNAPKDKNQYEIDIVALNEKKKQILFGECKWQEHISAERVIKELFDKAKSVLWYNKEREEFYVLFAKSFSKRIEEFEGRKVFCFDLGDIKKILKI